MDLRGLWLGRDQILNRKVSAATVLRCLRLGKQMPGLITWRALRWIRSRQEEGTPIQYCYPKEGVVGWFDSLVIPKGAKNYENAKTFMNWLMAPENMAMVSNFARYANAIPSSNEFLDEALAGAPENNPPADVEVRVSETCGPKFVKALDKIWTKLLQ